MKYSIKYEYDLNRSIWAINGTLIGTNPSVYTGHGSNVNEEAHYTWVGDLWDCLFVGLLVGFTKYQL